MKKQAVPQMTPVIIAETTATVIGTPIVCDAIGSCALGVAEVEVGDELTVQIVVGGFIEEVDVVGT